MYDNATIAQWINAINVNLFTSLTVDLAWGWPRKQMGIKCVIFVCIQPCMLLGGRWDISGRCRWHPQVHPQGVPRRYWMMKLVLSIILSLQRHIIVWNTCVDKFTQHHRLLDSFRPCAHEWSSELMVTNSLKITTEIFRDHIANWYWDASCLYYEILLTWWCSAEQSRYNPIPWQIYTV